MQYINPGKFPNAIKLNKTKEQLLVAQEKYFALESKLKKVNASLKDNSKVSLKLASAKAKVECISDNLALAVGGVDASINVINAQLKADNTIDIDHLFEIPDDTDLDVEAGSSKMIEMVPQILAETQEPELDDEVPVIPTPTIFGRFLTFLCFCFISSRDTVEEVLPEEVVEKLPVVEEYVYQSINEDNVDQYDWEKYISSYGDLVAVGFNTKDQAVDHWNTYGIHEGRIFPKVTAPIGGNSTSPVV